MLKNKRRQMMAFLFCCFLSVLFSGLASASTRIHGLLEWDYAHFESDVDGGVDRDADSFYQGYSIAIENRGQLFNGRGGTYDFTLGADWLSVESDITQGGIAEKISLENSKVVYNGDIEIAPGGLPFRLQLYSRDLATSRGISDRSLPEGSYLGSGLHAYKPLVLQPNVIDDIEDGIRMVSGANLVLGIRNGSYLGKYREVFSHFPKLFFDYKETLVKDLESLTPEHTLDRELAFISLNKKHNWFHYRYFEHINKLMPDQDYWDRLLMIGTVDQYYDREWINLTNWIQVSTDASYLVEQSPQRKVGVERTYGLNFFVKAKRRGFRSNAMSRYTREEQVGALIRRAVVPVSLSGVFDRNSSWMTRFVGNARKEYRPFAITNKETRDETGFTELKLVLNKQRKIVASPRLKLEVDRRNDGDGFAASVGLETHTNRKFKRQTNFTNDLFLNFFEGEKRNVSTGAVVADTGFWEANNFFTLNHDYSSRLKGGVKLDLTYGSGDLEYEFSKYIREESSSVMESSSQYTSTVVADEVLKAKFVLFADHVTVLGTKNQVGFRSEVIDTAGKSSTQTALTHGLHYRKGLLRYNMSNELVYGDRLSSGVSSEVFNVVFPLRSYSGVGYSHLSELTYRPNKAWTLIGGAELDWFDPDVKGGGVYAALFQQATFTHHKRVGLRRKYLTFTETLEYEFFDARVGADGAVGLLLLESTLYPNTWSSVGGKLRYQSDFENGSDEVGFGLYAGIDFSKLDITAEYETGMRTKDDAGAILERNEQRWKLNVKKTF